MNKPTSAFLRRVAVASCAALTSVTLLAACGSDDGGDTATQAEPTRQQGAVGNATPAATTGTPATPAGTTSDFDSVDGAWLLGDTLVWRFGDTVKYLPGVSSDAALAEADLAGTAESLSLPPGCGEFSQSEDELVAGCTDQLVVVTADGELELTPTSRTFTAAITSEQGTFYVAEPEVRRVTELDADGEELGSENGPLNTVKFVRVGADVIAFDRAETVLMSVHTDTNRGAALRLGVGGGEIIAGPEQAFYATDALGGQAMVYTTNVIRLHQTGVVPASPWALNWDAERAVLWTASTGEPLATAMDPASGSLTRVAELPIIGDARAILTLADGALVIISGGDQPGSLQVIPADEVSAAFSS